MRTTSNADTLSDRPAWIPDWVPAMIVAQLPMAAEHPDAVRDVAVLLCESPCMKPYWQSEVGCSLSEHPEDFWALAKCVVDNRPGATGRGRVLRDWQLTSRAKRREFRESLQSRARALRELIVGSHMDARTGGLQVFAADQGKRTGRPSNPERGEELSYYLEALERFATKQAIQDESLPAYSNTADQADNLFIAAVFHFHRKTFGFTTAGDPLEGEPRYSEWHDLTKTVYPRTANVVSAVLGKTIGEGRVRNAIRQLLKREMTPDSAVR